MKYDLILASASPRRRELMERTGLTFLIDAPDVDESCTLGAKAAVAELSRRKALAAGEKHPGEIILAADTLVALEDKPLGKPVDAEDACRMLRMLSGREHQVYTGVTCISCDGHIYTGVDASTVHFEKITDEMIRRYVATGEPLDKAGAYALQGGAALFISHVEGSPSGIIGLPLALTAQLLRKCGLDI